MTSRDDELPELGEPELNAVERLEKAVREYVNEVIDSDTPILVDTAVLVWEQVRLDDEGRAMRKIDLCSVTGNTNLSATAGLLSLGSVVLDDILSDDGDE